LVSISLPLVPALSFISLLESKSTVVEEEDEVIISPFAVFAAFGIAISSLHNSSPFGEPNPVTASHPCLAS
jgi:hypothetical protein